MRAACGALAIAALAGCPGARGSDRPRVAPRAPLTLPLDTAGGSLRGVAGDDARVFVAITRVAGPTSGAPAAGPATGPRTTIEARHGAAVRWQRAIDGAGGPLARTGAVVAAVVSGSGAAAELALRGDPGSVIVALDAATGAPRWRLAVDASAWALVTAIAPTTDGFVIGGAFAGTLRIGDHVVSSAGKSDGFVARISATGAPAWLVRAGGGFADGVAAVAAAGDRIAIAGTIGPDAELHGAPLPVRDERSPAADVFVAELDGRGARRWSATFGGAGDDAVGGIAIDGRGRIAVATTLRESVRINLAEVIVEGPGAGVVTYFAADGAAGPSVVLGGPALAGTSALAAAGDHVVVAGFFAGTIRVGRETVRAAGGDDAYLAELDGGRVVRVLPVAGPGREEVPAVVAVPGGWIAGVAHTAGATVDAATLPSPADPMAGAAVLVRPAR